MIVIRKRPNVNVFAASEIELNSPTFKLRRDFEVLDYFAKRSRAFLFQVLYHVIIRDNQRRKTFTSESN
jgi:hypothetical protein